MKEESIAFSVIAPEQANRFEDRVSFLYVEYARVMQSRLGVVAVRELEEGGTSEQQIPVAQLATLFLGPGTSITTPAITSAARSGCTVLFSGGQGYPLNSRAMSLTSSGRWAIAQAEVVSDRSKARAVAREFYRKQFGDSSFAGSISQMRALEGSIIKKLYAMEARKARLGHFHRDTGSDDNVNVALNIANSLLYGLAASVTASFAMSESLGVIHRGNVKAFLFDLADLYKAEISIPVAFSAHSVGREELPSYVRRAVRKKVVKRKLMKDLSQFITTTFKPYMPEIFDDRLLSGYGEDVEGHRNYGDQ